MSYIDIPVVEEIDEKKIIRKFKEVLNREDSKVNKVSILIGKGNYFEHIAVCSTNLKYMDNLIEKEKSTNPELVVRVFEGTINGKKVKCIVEKA